MADIEFAELVAAARRLGTDIADTEADDFHALARWMVGQVDRFMEQSQHFVAAATHLRGPRRVIGVPTPDEDPYNAILRWAEVEADEDERTSDLLAGKRIALKDLISVAGLPLTGASELFHGYVPDEDAILVERILRAGGRIVAFTNMEGMAFGGGGESGCFGPTLNPFDLGRSTSGSSGGSAAALYYDGVDIAFGTDQGGSIRQPASWCGVIGLKPTHGLVPYTGILSHDPTIDHVGPMARTVLDIALAMEAVAGWSDADPRQAAVPRSVGGFVAAVTQAPKSLAGLRIGVLEEALDDDGSNERGEVLAGFREVERLLGTLGAEVVTMSIPIHRVAGPIMFAAMLEGIAATLHGHGEGYHWEGRYSPSLRRAVGQGLLARGADLPPAYKTAAAVGEHLRTRQFGTVYATARNVARVLTAAYDAVLQDVDLIVMPTTPGVAMTLSTGDSMLDTQLRSFTMGSSLGADTPAHNLTGHPALSIPAAEACGLPSGVMLVGSRFSDARLLSVARVWEEHFGWRPTRLPIHLAGSSGDVTSIEEHQ